MYIIPLVTYRDRTDDYFESIDNQQAHEKRIAEWLNNDIGLSVLAFTLGYEIGMLIAVGPCHHQDLFDSVMKRDTKFSFNGNNYAIQADIGGFCVEKSSASVVRTRDSADFGPIESALGNIHQQMIINKLNNLFRLHNANSLRSSRKKYSPVCKKPILPPADQLNKLQQWKKLYDGWNYEKKQGFPAIPSDILEQTKNIPPFDGFRPAVEINFYLSTLEEHLLFVFNVLWKHEFGSECRQCGGSIGKDLDASIRKGSWPGKTVQIVGTDIEAYSEKEGSNADQVCQLEQEPIHVESLNHLLLNGIEPEYKGDNTIPGIDLYHHEWEAGELAYHILSGAYGVAVENDKVCFSAFIASRVFSAVVS